MTEGDYEYREWEKRVPYRLLPAVEQIRDSFREAEWKSNWTTQAWCYALLHPDDKLAFEKAMELTATLEVLQASLKPAALHLVQHHLKLGTPPAMLKAFLDIHAEVMSARIQATFYLLFELAVAHPAQMPAAPANWAAWQVCSLIRLAKRQIGLWLKCCCDIQQFDPDDRSDEYIFWRKWQSPMFVSMQPGLGKRPFDPSRIWEREDLERSGEVIDHFERYFVVYLETALKTQLNSCQPTAKVNVASAVQQGYFGKTGTL